MGTNEYWNPNPIPYFCIEWVEKTIDLILVGSVIVDKRLNTVRIKCTHPSSLILFDDRQLLSIRTIDHFRVKMTIIFFIIKNYPDNEAKCKYKTVWMEYIQIAYNILRTTRVCLYRQFLPKFRLKNKY